jgi:UDPglucose 6-dehydrogenase
VKKTKIAFVGLGYVGLSTALCLADNGFQVQGFDVDKRKVKALRDGNPLIHEKGIDLMLRRTLRSGKFIPEDGFRDVSESKIIFITVGTPSRPDGSIETEYVESAAREVGKQLRSASGYHLVVVKSTVIPGTTEGKIRPSIERESGRKIGTSLGLASNPEFLHEGAAVYETLHPDALVIGGADKKSSATLKEMYDSFYGKPQPTVLTTIPNAEMMKYAINSGRASQLSFVNTIANYCTRVPGCDYSEVRKGLSLVAKMDGRYLSAGLGFGGSCLPKDARALAAALKTAGVDPALVSSSLTINDNQVNEAIRLAEGIGGGLEGKRVAVLGLAFKAGTDDIRESVSIALVGALLKKRADVHIYDPVAMKNAKALLGSQVTYAKSAKDCIRNSDCAFIATGWDEFLRIRPADFRRLMKSPILVDGRRIYDQRKYLIGKVKIKTIGTCPADESLSPSDAM